MKFLAAAGLAGACLATTPLFAADLFESAPPPLDAPMAQQSELGANWYIRGDVGYGVTNQPTVVPQAGLIPPTQFAADGTPFNDAPSGNASSPVSVTRGNNKSVTGADFDIGFGYRVNDWLRVEATYDFSRGPGFSTQQQVYCPGAANAVTITVINTTTSTTMESEVINGNTVLVPVTTTTQAPVTNTVGYSYDWSKCNGVLNTSQYNNTVMAAALVDLGHWGMFSPFVGAGVGLNANTITGTLTYNNVSDGSNYTGPKINGSAPAIWMEPTAPTAAQFAAGNAYWYVPLVNGKTGQSPAIEIGPQNWNRTINSTKYTIAGQLMAGVGIQISQSATLDLAYKFLSYDITKPTQNYRQALTLGVRYNLN